MRSAHGGARLRLGDEAFQQGEQDHLHRVLVAGVADDTPIVDCDARNKDSVKMVLLTLLESLVAKAQARAHMR